MNKSEALIEKLNEINKNSIVYDQNRGLKLLRFGTVHSDFARRESEFRRIKPPASRGFWASIFPHNPFTDFPGVNDGTVHRDVRDQTTKAKLAYQNAQDDFLLQPVKVYWKLEIYSHIDKSGTYQPNHWTLYPQSIELYRTIVNNFNTLQQSVKRAKSISQNLGNKSNIIYFDNNEFEVFIPHEPA